MEMILHSHANKTHFHKKGCALGLILKLRVFGTQKWPIGSLLLIFNCFKIFFPIKINKLYSTFDSCKKCLNGLCKFKIVVGNSPENGSSDVLC